MDIQMLLDSLDSETDEQIIKRFEQAKKDSADSWILDGDCWGRTMDDLISRAAAVECAIDAVDDWDGGWNPNRETVIRKYFAEVPAVDAAPVVQGEWVEEPDRVNHYHCSNCGVVWGIMSKAMKYCPNCAAKMMNSPMWEVERNNGKDA